MTFEASNLWAASELNFVTDSVGHFTLDRLAQKKYISRTDVRQPHHVTGL